MPPTVVDVADDPPDNTLAGTNRFCDPSTLPVGIAHARDRGERESPVAPQSKSDRPTRPNALWICTDQQRFDTLGCYGNDFVSTPNIDRLARNGVLFENFYTQSPVCAPSRASFLTGRYPRTTRLRQNGTAIPGDEVPVTKLLAEAGYVCGLVGKLHLGWDFSDSAGSSVTERRIDDGFSFFHWSMSTFPDWRLGVDTSRTNEYHHWLRAKGVEFEYSPFQGSKYVENGIEAEHHQSAWCAEKGIGFIEANASFEDPWLLFVSPFDPHHPFDPPPEYLEPYLDRLDDIPLPNYVEGELEDKPVFQQLCHEGAYNVPGAFAYDEMDGRDHRLIRAAYWAMVDLIDVQVGRMLEALERTGQLEDTIVIFTADHGEMLGDHGIYLKGPFLYEPAIRVPFIVSWPGTIPGGRRSAALVEATDIAPTLLDAAALPRAPGMQGRSLWGLLTGDDDLDGHREDIYSEYYNSSVMFKPPDPLAFLTMVRSDRYKLVAVHGLGTGELYDLEKDPAETRNLWRDSGYRDVKLSMLERLADRMAQTVDPLPVRATNHPMTYYEKLFPEGDAAVADQR